MKRRMEDMWFDTFDGIIADAKAGRITAEQTVDKLITIGIDRDHAEGHARVAQGVGP